MDTKQERAIKLVLQERTRQNTLKAQGRFRYTCADAELSNAEKVCILVEEVGEVARAVLGQPERPLVMDQEGSKEELKREIVQVVAVGLAIVEGLL